MESITRRCRIAAIIALAALLPNFQLLKTSPAGLALITNLEGCSLTPYQCSAGVWTSGIGHTAGVRPQQNVTEHEVAVNLIGDVLSVERQLAICVPIKMPQPVFDALVSFTFNVGGGAACRSTLVFFIKHQQWLQACDQLTRWVFIDGVRNQGLENRRIRERARCLEGVK